MTQSLLLPNRYKKLGWSLFFPSLLLGIIITTNLYKVPEVNANVFSLIPQFSLDKSSKMNWFFDADLVNTIIGVLFIAGALLIGFSKEKNEDEYIDKLRLSALLWAVLLNYLLLIIAFLLVYDIGFITIMIYNMFTVLLLFLFRFHYLLYRAKITASYEK